MNKDELALIEIVRNLKPYESIEIKMDENGKIVYTYTRKERHVFLTRIV